MADLEANPFLVQIPISKLPVYECAAILFSHLTFPAQNESAQRNKVQIAICHQFLEEKSRREPDWQFSLQKVKPQHLKFSEKQAEKFLSKFHRRYRDRMGAACIAYPYIMDSTHRIFPQKEFEVKNLLSISRMSEVLAPNLRQKDPVNIHSRIWRPSIPVIHLAVAISMCLNDLIKGDQTILYSLMSNSNFLVTVVEASNLLAYFVMRSPKLQQASEALIRFRLT